MILKNQFAKDLKLLCLNPEDWGRGCEEKITFQKAIGDKYVSSIIDYGLATYSALQYIKNFEIDTDGKYSTSSDHATLFIELNIPVKEVEGEAKPTLKISNRKFFKQTVSAKLRNITDIKNQSVN